MSFRTLKDVKRPGYQNLLSEGNGTSMIREIIHDPVFLAHPSQPAEKDDLYIAEDLIDTLRANMDRCVGMAANMIGKLKRIIVMARGPIIVVMISPVILSASGEYETEEGCLSLEGTRKTKRYRSIRLKWQDMQMEEHIGILDGFQAQIVQHEIDHCDGKLI